MSDPITLEDIYKLFERSQAEADKRAAEADKRAADFERSLAESRADFERSLAESRADFERSMAESRAEFDRRAVEADRRAAEADRRAAEADRRAAERTAEANEQLKEVKAIAAQAMRSVDALSSRWGRFVENLVAPGAVRLFQSRGIAVKEVHQRMRAVRGAIKMEVDVFAVDDTVAVAIEVKSRLTQKHISEFIENLKQFKVAFPAYKDYQIYGAVAGIEIDEGIDRYAYKQGLFVIKQSGETVEIDNDEDFKPTVW